MDDLTHITQTGIHSLPGAADRKCTVRAMAEIIALLMATASRIL